MEYLNRGGKISKMTRVTAEILNHNLIKNNQKHLIKNLDAKIILF